MGILAWKRVPDGQGMMRRTCVFGVGPRWPAPAFGERTAMTRSRIRQVFGILASLPLAAGLVFSATLASAELTAWDQEKVTAVAAELMAATGDLQTTLRRQPPPTLGQPGRRAFHQLRDDVATIDSTARRLHGALTEGAGREETFPTYRRMISSVRSASDEIGRISLGEPATGKLQAAGAVLRRLRPFYEEEPVL